MRLRCGLVLAMLVMGVPFARGEHQHAGVPLRVIVQGRDLDTAAAAVTAAGGTITHRLGIINAVGAALAPAQLDRLRRSPAVVRVFEDHAVGLHGEKGRPSYTPALVGADRLHALGITGRGITVAVLDTGWWNAPGTLTDTTGAARIVAGYNAITDTTGLDAVEDANGHGTHVLSIAASSNYTGTTLAPVYNGVAPDARIVVVQAFDDNGWGSYASVIRGIEWVVAHKDQYGIRVLNCSFGAPPRSHYWEDPLNQAIMRAWQAGIVVVVSSGNTGPGPQSVRAPGNVPYVITVGAMTDNYTPDLAADDRLASFSSAGPTYDRFVKPDLVAPGGHVLGLMDHKAMLPREHRQYVDKENVQYFTMSGTSQSAAVVSGAAALLLQAHPELTPDAVKCRFLSTATAALDPANHRAYSVFQQGTGLVSASGAVISTSNDCANAGLSVGDDLSGAQHFAGRARQNAAGVFSIDGLAADGTIWDGQLQGGGGVFLQGDPWTEIAASLQGDPWTENFAWPSGYPWDADFTWSTSLRETMAINVWVPQQ